MVGRIILKKIFDYAVGKVTKTLDRDKETEDLLDEIVNLKHRVELLERAEAKKKSRLFS